MAGARKKPNKKNGNYQGYYQDYTGKRVFFTGTTSRQETKQIARHLEDEHRQMSLGAKPLPTAPARYRQRPFLEVVQEYIDWGKVFGRHDGKGWTADYADRVDRYLRKWAETLSIETLADLDGLLPRVEAVVKELADQGFTGRGMACRVDPLTALCRWCVGHGYLRENPLRDLAQIDQTPERERRALTTEEIAKLFTVAPAWRQLLYATAIASGLRLSELRRLDRGDLDIGNARLRLRWRTTKNRKPAYVYLPVKLIEQLAAFADSHTPKLLYERARSRKALPEAPLLFVPRHVVRALYQDLEKIGVPKATTEGHLDFHGLRVAAVTLAIESGATVKEAQTMARHATPAMTMNVYAKARDSRMAALAERIGGVLPIPAMECATEVQSVGDPVTAPARKSLPEPALLQNEEAEGSRAKLAALFLLLGAASFSRAAKSLPFPQPVSGGHPDETAWLLFWDRTSWQRSPMCRRPLSTGVATSQTETHIL
jgi:integrase